MLKMERMIGDDGPLMTKLEMMKANALLAFAQHAIWAYASVASCLASP